MQNKTNYRKDIDGLRAIAVLGVIFYHSEILINDKLLLSGGFLGVDIFFVISGYLITSIIYREYKKKNKFSFLNFYERRVRRLLPALLIILSASIIFGYFLLLPTQFKSYLDSIISSVFFYSNFYFHYSGQAYGEAILSTKPLLHTWSLAVEEQFYILFPIIFIIIIKYFRSYLKLFIYLGILLSIAFASIIVEKHSSFNFYMIITRAWELLSGSAIALHHAKGNNQFKNYNLKFFGLILILFSFYFFNDPNQHPSLLTLIPITGCCLIIYDTNKNNIVDKLLSQKILVNIGLISYSLYLWHHPILSFGKISGLTENNLAIKILLVLISFILSFLTYTFIESKFRNKRIFSIKQISVIMPSVVLILISLTIFLPNKQIKIYPIILSDLYEQTWFTTKQFGKPCFQRKKIFCKYDQNNSDKTIFLVGDSIMASMQEQVKNNLLSKHFKFIPMTNAGCDFTKISENKNNFCNKNVHENRVSRINKNKKSILILHLNYRNMDENYKKLEQFISNINYYLNLDYKIILIYPIPQFSENVSQILHKLYKKDKANFFQNIQFDKNHIKLDLINYKHDTKKITDKFNNLNHKNLFKVLPQKIFCNENECNANSTKDIYFIDGSHLSKKGAEMINIDLMNVISKIQF